jgi:hypothetical protein
MKITKQLATFLANEGSLTRFINNYTNEIHKYGDFNITISEMTSGFQWSESTEGIDFWIMLASKYNNENK